jgi:hypothetical protein
MDEIKTRIDQVHDFITARRKTTFRELLRESKLNRDELDKYVHVLCKYGLIKAKYGWFDTYLYIEKDNVTELIDEFKSLLDAGSIDDTVTSDKDEDATDKNLKIIAMKSILSE